MDMKPTRFSNFTIVAFVLMFFLQGCVSNPQKLEGSGIPTETPIGYSVACAKDPTLPFCGGR